MKNYNIELNSSEAIVLFEFLSREEKNLPTNNYSEKKIIWKVLGFLEKELSEPFSLNYPLILAKAKEDVQGLDKDMN